jgi:hypothetical protein
MKTAASTAASASAMMRIKVPLDLCGLNGPPTT